MKLFKIKGKYYNLIQSKDLSSCKYCCFNSEAITYPQNACPQNNSGGFVCVDSANYNLEPYYFKFTLKDTLKKL